jgi:nitroreductase
MNDKLNLIFKRRSIRAYSDKPVTKEMILEIVKAGMAAPSAINAKPWHITVIEDANLRDKIAATSERHRGCCRTAPYLLLVSGDSSRYTGEWAKVIEDFMPQDCSAMVQNLLIAATAFDLGSLWMGIFPYEAMIKEIRELLDLPEHLIPFALVAIGHRGEEKDARTQYEEGQVLWK